MALHPFLPRDLPRALELLTELALDLRWTWSHAGDALWRRLDAETWEATHNPWVILQSVPRARLDELAADDDFCGQLDALAQDRLRYHKAGAPEDGPPLSHTVAYFSLEFGLGVAVPLYAGGLGVLAGDHLKAAADMGVPLVGVGLLYQEGYFRQTIDHAGRQEELYPYNDPTSLPIQPVIGREGGWLGVAVELPGRLVRLRVWRATVGRVSLYLLDSNTPTNSPIDRGITGKLYGDGPEMRLRQEMVLGMGGWRALQALGVDVGACHLNEGHAAFVVLERARDFMRAHGVPFRTALWATRPGNAFTTHTPVAAGFDAFEPELIAKYFAWEGGYLTQLGLDLDNFLALGRVNAGDPHEPFRPAYLAMRGAGSVNAVSKLHGETSRHLFEPLFPRWPRAEVPVSHITNGVHAPVWDSRHTDALWTDLCGKHRWRGTPERLEAAMQAVSDEVLWTTRAAARRDLVTAARERLLRQLARRAADRHAVAYAHQALDADVLTLGFARRMASYKRPNLLLRDPARLARLLTDPRRPTQLLVAGKAHPEDQGGRALVEEWVRFANDPALRHRVVFIEDYDFEVAQELVQGVDVWINTPRRPWEACGTSGMKVLVNGGLNVSILDGWWAEAYSPETGWAIGALPEGPPSEQGNDGGDEADAESLFRCLEDEVVPLFYERDERGIPTGWLARVRASLTQLAPRFSAGRMMSEYLGRVYAPAEHALARRQADGARAAQELAAREQRLATHGVSLRWGRVEDHPNADGTIEVSLEIFLDDLQPGDVRVELFAEGRDAGSDPLVVAMTDGGTIPGTTHGRVFRARIPANRPASDYTPRLRADGDGAFPLELPFIFWQR